MVAVLLLLVACPSCLCQSFFFGMKPEASGFGFEASENWFQTQNPSPKPQTLNPKPQALSRNPKP